MRKYINGNIVEMTTDEMDTRKEYTTKRKLNKACRDLTREMALENGKYYT